MGWGKEGDAGGEQCSRGGLAMAGGEVVTDARGTRPTGHGSKNRGHRETAGVKGNPPRPIRRPEGSAETSVVMAGDESTWPHAKRVLEAMK